MAEDLSACHDLVTDECASSFLASNRFLWMIAALTVVFFSLTNLPWQLDDFSQERQALASFDMVKEGRWLYQQAPRDREATKPPEIPWISAGIYGATGSWDVAWRLPSFAAALALAALIFQAARRRFGRLAAAVALSAFALNMLSPRLATLVRTDMPLALVVFVIGLQIWRKIEAQERWNRRDRWLLFLLLTIGVFIKGPIIYVFLLPAIGLFQWRWRKMPAAQAWSGSWPWLASLGIFTIWVAGGIVTQPGFFDQVIMHEFLGRFSSSEQRPHPPYYYMGHLLHKFAPWSELLLILTALHWRRARESLRSVVTRMGPDLFWLGCWSLSGLIIMSLVPSKRLDRIFPVLPPFCLLLAGQLAAAGRVPALRRQAHGWTVVALAAALVLSGQYVATKVVSGYRGHRDALVKFGHEVRDEAVLKHWRYEVVTSHDGGMLLYLNKTHFVEPDQATAEWNRGEIDALVMREGDANSLREKLPGGLVVCSSISQQRGSEHRNRYVLVARMRGEN
ncbi:MAG: hypothetical protein QOH24_169 [Verrucomicrobiota bacterium]|jgi:4-amino-4-deoxy-L-arabinose transferase-like glycosyltransferase